MKIILKPLFELATGDIAVCDNIVYNYIIMFGVGELAFQLAYNSIGYLYKDGMISGRGMGSIIHWLVRIIIYVLVAYLLRVGIWIYEFVQSVPKEVWIGIGITFVLIVLSIIIKTVRRKNKSVKI